MSIYDDDEDYDYRTDPRLRPGYRRPRLTSPSGCIGSAIVVALMIAGALLLGVIRSRLFAFAN